MSSWIIFIVIYSGLAIASFLPVAKAMLRKFSLNEARFSFSDCPNFSEKAKLRLEQHYSRLQGTLVFWKNTAEKYGHLHHYCIFWIIVGGIAIPVLIQSIDSGQNQGFVKWIVTAISVHVAILSAIHKGFKVEQNYKNYRLGESDYYDLRRRLLDQPYKIADSEEEQINRYFSDTEIIRRDMRNREIDSTASFEDIKATVNSLAGRVGKDRNDGENRS